jgi:hypothetical protein
MSGPAGPQTKACVCNRAPTHCKYECLKEGFKKAGALLLLLYSKLGQMIANKHEASTLALGKLQSLFHGSKQNEDANSCITQALELGPWQEKDRKQYNKQETSKGPTWQHHKCTAIQEHMPELLQPISSIEIAQKLYWKLYFEEL